MSIKDMIKEVENAAEGLVLPKDTDAVAKELKEGIAEKLEAIEVASDTMLGIDREKIGAEISEKIGHLAKEIEDASDVMILSDKPKE